MPKVSVIVPVYNTKKKLPRCLDSLLSQTLSDIEIILVNDASTDGSYDVLLEYERMAPERILLVNSDTRSGAGGARNIGLDMTSGDYIGFVDADDFVQEDMFACLYGKAIEEGYDIVDSPAYILASDSLQRAFEDEFCGKHLSTIQREILVLADGYIWTKLFKRQLIEEQRIRFRPNVKLEDADFLLKAMLHAELFGKINEPKYVYDNTSDDTWSVKAPSSSDFDSVYELLDEYGRILRMDERAKECRTAIKGAILHFYYAGISCCAPGDGEDLSAENKKRLKKLRKVKNKIFEGGYDNPYLLHVHTDAEIELMKYIDSAF